MSHYLFKARYTQQGMAGVMKEGAASRVRAVRQLVESAGGKVEAAYWALGDDDFILVADLPDNAAAVALATTVAGTGTAAVSTTVLLTAKDVDEARGRTIKYRAPGA